MKNIITTTSDNFQGESEKNYSTELSPNPPKKEGWVQGLGDLVNTSIPRLFLILSFSIYGVVAFSKKEQGVLSSDLFSLLFFVIFVFVIFGLLIVFRDLYRLRIFQQVLSFGLTLKLKNNLRMLILFLVIMLVAMFLFREGLFHFFFQFQK